MENKKQITGMMRLLSDKAGRIYQRVGSEGDSLKQEPQEMHQSWAQPVTFPLVSEDHQLCVWSSTGEPVSALSSNTTSVPNGQGYNQYSTRSKTLRMLNNAKGAVKTNGKVQRIAQENTLLYFEPLARDNVRQENHCAEQT